jgi:hypothetical protein
MVFYFALSINYERVMHTISCSGVLMTGLFLQNDVGILSICGEGVRGVGYNELQAFS